MDWPDDDDGWLLGQLQSYGFDFSRPTVIDFSVWFEERLPTPRAVEALATCREDAVVETEGRNVSVQVNAKVSYPFVSRMRAELTELAEPYGGVCESWGVLFAPGG